MKRKRTRSDLPYSVGSIVTFLECRALMCISCGVDADITILGWPYCKYHADDVYAKERAIHLSHLSEFLIVPEEVPDWWPIELLRDNERISPMPHKWTEQFILCHVSYKTSQCIYCDERLLRCVPRGPGRVKGYVCQPCTSRRDSNAGKDGFCPVCGVKSPSGTGWQKRLYCDRHIRRNSNIRRYPTGASLSEIVERDGWQCHLCRKPITDLADATRDHLVPKSHGGSDDPDNLAAAHMRCNSRRRTRPLEAVVT